MLTGTFTRSEQSSPLAEGKVAKNTFTFKATLNEQTEAFSGRTGRRGHLDSDGPSRVLERAVVLKRVKK